MLCIIILFHLINIFIPLKNINTYKAIKDMQVFPIGYNSVKIVTQCSRVSTQNQNDGLNTLLPNITSDV